MDAAYIRLRFPGVFDAVTDFSLDAAIAAAQAQVSLDLNPTIANEATLYLACHLAELGKLGRASGLVEVTAGQVSMKFGGQNGSGGETSFLLLYKQMIRRAVFPITLGIV